MYFRTVYYTRFWYSRFANIGTQGFSGNVLSAEVALHLFSLRLLALFFDHIYIPRTHALTQFSALQSEIAQAVFQTRDIAFLREAGILRVSTFPGLDAKADTERILARAGRTTDVTYPTSAQFLLSLPVTQPFVVDSASEAKADTHEFAEYARWLAIVSESLSRRVANIVDQSTIHDVPFFHERFLRQVRETLRPDDFERVWRDSNSVYVTSGVPDHAGVIAYFDPSIESPSYRHKPFGIDRFLFNPASLVTFLTFLFTEHELRLLRHAPIDSVLDGLHDLVDAWRVGAFRRAYCDIVRELSEFTDDPLRANAMTQEGMMEWYRKILDGTLKGRRTAAEQFAHGLQVAGESADAIGGVTGALAKPTVALGARSLTVLLRRRRHPAIFEFANHMRATLKKIS